MFNSLLNGWYHGKAMKCSRHNSLDQALNYYQKALNYAKKDGNLGSVAIETECIALTYSRLNNKKLAIRYAERGIDIYQTNLDEKAFRDGVTRLKLMIEKLRAEPKTRG